MSKPDNGIRALERGLALLEELNRCDGARPTALSKALGLPRSSVYRILETLEELHYVERSATDSRFRVTDRVWLLARGVTRTKLGSVGGPVIRRLSAEIHWPVDVCSYDAGKMFTQETTHRLSPMSLARSMVGLPLPLLRTASGRAFLAFCDPDEQAAMLALAEAAGDPEDLPYLDRQSINRLLTDTRTRGYSIRSGEPALPTSSSDKTSSIGVPILKDGRPVGAIVVIWITSALSLTEAVGQFLAPLRQAAETIAAEL
ncbi:helix-turn-helix domain-containing protein [Pseudooceanicola sp. 216_PA32_1]|uniref:Helix-turn-helix domain-containing protein n=1 Tax=Pseudooceanicola pacificus TaxID=2676438 RepID=A0A844W856_9RHOB|nr:helix-turn-helix domain-containing protein [Pseudooceanicola pacificus]MWB79061.1 helix-turn-helix domain-containing protein [Pseudooceanicola pacificus]